jgi:hypothetical protein
MKDAPNGADESTPARRPGRTWRYEQTLPGESPDLALERATTKFESGVARMLRTFDRPVRIRAEIQVVELPVAAPSVDAPSGNAVEGDDGAEQHDEREKNDGVDGADST